MKNQLDIFNRGGALVVDSRQVAEVVGKRHADLLRDIDRFYKVLTQNAKLRSDDFFIKSSYKAGTGKNYVYYLCTKKGCDMVANKLTGEKGVLFTAEYINRFDEMEKQLANPYLAQIPKDLPSALIAYAQALKEKNEALKANEILQKQIETDKPKVKLAEAIETSNNSISIGDLAKILKQSGINIGQNRLMKWLRDNGFLIKRKGAGYNSPTQNAIDMKLFEIGKKSYGNTDLDTEITTVILVTGKGQFYFIDKLKNNNNLKEIGEGNE